MRSGCYSYFIPIGNRVGGMGCVVDSFRVLDRQLASASRGKSDTTLQSYRFLAMGPYNYGSYVAFNAKDSEGYM